MKRNLLRSIKNSSMLLLKLISVVFLIFIILHIGKGFLGYLSDDYSNYALIRGLDKYGVSDIAYLENSIVEGDFYNSTYKYDVGDVEYTISIYTNLSLPIDETVEILYDSINPNVNIEKSTVKEIDSFYSDVLKQMLFLYIKVFGLVIIFSALWFGIDVLKYNKPLWKQYV